MPRKPPRKPLFDRLKAGLEEGIAYSAGTLNLRTVDVPESPASRPRRPLVERHGVVESQGNATYH
jgi:hypothetical protein